MEVIHALGTTEFILLLLSFQRHMGTLFVPFFETTPNLQIRAIAIDGLGGGRKTGGHKAQPNKAPKRAWLTEQMMMGYREILTTIALWMGTVSRGYLSTRGQILTAEVDECRWR